MATSITGICKQSGCPWAQNGKCLEDFAPENINSCPYFVFKEGGQSSEIDDATAEEELEEGEQEVGLSTPPPVSQSIIRLRDGKSVPLAAAVEIMRSAVTRLIVIAGDSESGKSTLLSCIHERFIRGPYAGHLFAGSRTLVGFEQLCHDSRITSERAEGDTERTKVGEGIRFFHLALRDQEQTMPIRHVLLSNISGEIFDQAKDLSEEAHKLAFLRRADHFVLLLNGNQLSNIESRNKVLPRARSLLTRLLEMNLLDTRSRVDVAFSKWDVLKAMQDVDEDDTEAFLEKVKGNLRLKFEQQVGALHFFEVAARPSDPSLEEGYGLESTFKNWVEQARFLNIAREAALISEDAAMDDPNCWRYQRANRRALRFSNGLGPQQWRNS